MLADECGDLGVESTSQLWKLEARLLRALLRESGAALRVEEPVLDYVGRIVRTTREDPQLILGCSPRAGVMLLQTAKVLAALRGLGFVSPEEVKEMAIPVLRHRLVLRPEADIEGIQPDQIIHRVLTQVPVPR